MMKASTILLAVILGAAAVKAAERRKAFDLKNFNSAKGSFNWG